MAAMDAATPAASALDDIAALRVALAEAEARACAAEAEAARAVAQASSADAVIASLKLGIEKLRRELYGTRSERKARLLDQLELQLEDLEATAGGGARAGAGGARGGGAGGGAEGGAPRPTPVKAFPRKTPSRNPFPADLPRERVV